MRQIGARLVDTFDGVVLGRGAEAQSLDLREDEPHPMGALLAVLKFPQGGCVSVILSLDESGEIVGV